MRLQDNFSKRISSFNFEAGAAVFTILLGTYTISSVLIKSFQFSDMTGFSKSYFQFFLSKSTEKYYSKIKKKRLHFRAECAENNSETELFQFQNCKRSQIFAMQLFITFQKSRSKFGMTSLTLHQPDTPPFFSVINCRNHPAIINTCQMKDRVARHSQK